ncbi:unnamed protein product [Prunus armeniaca]
MGLGCCKERMDKVAPVHAFKNQAPRVLRKHEREKAWVSYEKQRLKVRGRESFWENLLRGERKR